MVDFRGTGLSVMEITHRSPEFARVDELSKKELRKFLKVPDNFEIMIQQGGATMQFAAVVHNCIGLRPAKKAMFFTSGFWSEYALREARKFIPADRVVEVTNLKDSNYSKMSDPSTWNIDPEASFFHICMNETTRGLEITDDFPYHLIPKDVHLIGDMSSNIGTREINWDRFSVIYAGAHKNLGPSGATLVIVRKDLYGFTEPGTADVMDWTANINSGPHLGNAPLYINTPPVWAIYVTGLNASYMNQRGGLELYIKEASIKSKMVFDLVENSNGYYVNPIDPANRSRINIYLRIGCPINGNPELEQKLMAEAEKVDILKIGGHVTSPGLRISLYNAQPIAGVEAFCKFFTEFMRENPIPKQDDKTLMV